VRSSPQVHRGAEQHPLGLAGSTLTAELLLQGRVEGRPLGAGAPTPDDESHPEAHREPVGQGDRTSCGGRRGTAEDGLRGHGGHRFFVQVWQGSGRDGASRPDGIRARRGVTTGRDPGTTEQPRPGRGIDRHQVQRMHTKMRRERGPTFRGDDPPARLIDIPRHGAVTARRRSWRWVPCEDTAGQGRSAAEDHCAGHHPGAGVVIRTSGPSRRRTSAWRTRSCQRDPATEPVVPRTARNGVCVVLVMMIEIMVGPLSARVRNSTGVNRELCPRRENSSDILPDRATPFTE